MCDTLFIFFDGSQRITNLTNAKTQAGLEMRLPISSDLNSVMVIQNGDIVPVRYIQPIRDLSDAPGLVTVCKGSQTYTGVLQHNDKHNDRNSVILRQKSDNNINLIEICQPESITSSSFTETQFHPGFFLEDP